MYQQSLVLLSGLTFFSLVSQCCCFCYFAVLRVLSFSDLLLFDAFVLNFVFCYIIYYCLLLDVAFQIFFFFFRLPTYRHHRVKIWTPLSLLVVLCLILYFYCRLQKNVVSICCFYLVAVVHFDLYRLLVSHFLFFFFVEHFGVFHFVIVLINNLLSFSFFFFFLPVLRRFIFQLFCP